MEQWLIEIFVRACQIACEKMLIIKSKNKIVEKQFYSKKKIIEIHLLVSAQ